MFRARLALPLALLAPLAPAPAAQAGVYTDDLGKCMVAHMTEPDRRTLVRWIVLAFASHPDMIDTLVLKPEAAQPIQKAMADLVERLLTEDCMDLAKTAVKFEGQMAIGAAFELVGSVAGREASSSPEVAGVMQGFVAELDQARLQSVLFGN